MSAAALRVTVRHAVGESAILEGSLPPFTGLVGEVAVRRQQLDEARQLVERRTHWYIQLGAFIFPIDVIPCDSVLKRISSRRHRSQGGAAKRCGDVTPLEYEALFGQLVKMRRFDLRMPHEPVVRPCLVVTQNKNDIGWLLRCE